MAKVKVKRRRNARVAARRVRARVRANPARRVSKKRKSGRVKLVPVAIAANPRIYPKKRKGYRRNPMRARKIIRYYSRRKNPRIFGMQRSGLEMTYMVVGALAGMAFTKFLPTLAPRFSTTNVGRTIASGVSAVLTYLVAGALFKDNKNEYIADSVLLGGLIQTGSVALNAFLPGVARQAGLTGGLGAFAPAQFPVPQNPILAAAQQKAIPAPTVPSPTAQKMSAVSGIGRAFGSAF